MNIIILGAAGFIGTNIAIKLSKNKKNTITLVDKDLKFFSSFRKLNLSNIKIVTSSLDENMDFNILDDQDVVYHLVSTNIPTTSNAHVCCDIQTNVIFSSMLFDACVEKNINKVVFISSGGTVYGKEAKCPLSEETPTNPITSYGLQKITIEKLLYLYHYMYGLDYRIIRLANPYGPYQRPNGILGAITTFTYKALKGEEIQVYGDGSVVRDFIYIDDAINALINIVEGQNLHHTFNVGSGHGTSINEVLSTVSTALNIPLKVSYKQARPVDVPINYLDISRYEKYYGQLNFITLEDGIKKTAEYMKMELL